MFLIVKVLRHGKSLIEKIGYNSHTKHLMKRAFYFSHDFDGPVHTYFLKDMNQWVSRKILNNQ